MGRVFMESRSQELNRRNAALAAGGTTRAVSVGLLESLVFCFLRWTHVEVRCSMGLLGFLGPETLRFLFDPFGDIWREMFDMLRGLPKLLLEFLGLLSLLFFSVGPVWRFPHALCVKQIQRGSCSTC